MEETELDVLLPPAAEVEEIDLSDVEDIVEDEELDVHPLNIDHNSRIILKKNTDLNSGDSSNARLFEKESNHSTFQSSHYDVFGDTSSEELEVSDEDAESFDALTLQEVSLDGIACVGTSQQFDSSSTFNYSSTVFKEECVTDSEYISEDEMDLNIVKKSCKSSSNKSRTNTLSFGLSVTGIPSSFKDAFSGISNTLSSLSIVNSFSSSTLLKNNSLCDASDDMQTPLMTCIEFLKSDISEDEATDVEELSEELNDTTDIIYQPIIDFSEPFQTNPQSGGGSVLDDALRCRKGDLTSSLDNSARKSSWTTEILSEDEFVSVDSDPDAVKNGTKKYHRKRLSNGYANADECLTDEEEVDLDSKEWTETDESGSVRQITQIKTETSIKLEGDDAALDSDLVSTTTTTTSTRVVTSVISDPDLQSEIESTFVQQLSEDDIRQSCEVTFNEVVKDNSTAKPEESEHDE